MLFKENNMNGLKKIALAAAIAAASSAQAELVSMDDSAMGETTGQAGLTIDITSAEVKIGEIAYQDEGFIAIKDVKFGGGTDVFGITGKGDGVFNDIQIMIDVAGSGTASEVRSKLGRTRMGGEMIAFAAPIVGGQYGDINGNNNYTVQDINDGDLVISASASDFTGILNSVDYGLQIGSIGLGKSTETIGSIGSGTVLVSDLNLTGYLGPTDIIIDGDDGGMNISVYFNASGSFKLPFMNVETKFAIHDSRGANKLWLGTDDKVNSMAHIQVNVGKATSITGVDGIGITIQNFDADIDFENIAIGGNSIGSLYITDLNLTADTVIYGH
jgi:uncharacterized protein DUF6160